MLVMWRSASSLTDPNKPRDLSGFKMTECAFTLTFIFLKQGREGTREEKRKKKKKTPSCILPLSLSLSLSLSPFLHLRVPLIF